MNTAAEHSAFMLVPTAAMEELSRKLDQLLDQPSAPVLDLPSMGIEPLHAYSAKETAKILSKMRSQSVYDIPEDELPRVKTVGNKVAFLGINILCYMHKLPPVDMPAVLEQYRSRLMQDRPRVRALNPAATGKTRVL